MLPVCVPMEVVINEAFNKAKTLEDADAVFAQYEKKYKKELSKIVEEMLLNDLYQTVITEGAEAVKSRTASMESAQAIYNMKSVALLISHYSRLQEGTVDPRIQAFVDVAKTLSNEEYNNGTGLKRAFAALVDKVAEIENNRQNPFTKTEAPTNTKKGKNNRPKLG